MMEVTSGEYIKNEVKETSLIDDDDLLDIKETSLTDWSEDESEKLSNKGLHSNSSFTDICDEFSKFLSQEGDISEIKETRLTDDDDMISMPKETDLREDITFEIKETDLTDFHDIEIKETDFSHGNISTDIKETDLTGSDDDFDYLDVVSNHSSEISKNNLVNKDKQNYSSSLFIETVANSYGDKLYDDNTLTDHKSTTLDDGDKTLENKDEALNGGDNFSDSIKFQDIETDYFETDCENETKDYDHTKIKFQDLESDFFETDCEAMETTVNSRNGYFQDIESDFFDDGDDSPIKESPSLNLKTNKPRTETYSKKSVTEKNKTAVMSNTLLRSTISELEKALNDSNILLSKRDQKIQELRSRNNELTRGLNRELDNASQIKLLLLEKDALIAEREVKISELQNEIKTINTELIDLRLYKINNISYNESSTEITDSVSSDNYGRRTLESENISGYKMERKASNDSQKDTSKQHQCRYKRQQKGHVTKTVSSESRCSHSEQTTRTTEYQSGTSSPVMDEKVTKTELHSNLRMKFMRDAFFYYMIGFHSDEQINAILAILDYGDKRQDFVLEAHKMRKLGKKFNVTKVSSRGLTFVQEEVK